MGGGFIGEVEEHGGGGGAGMMEGENMKMHQFGKTDQKSAMSEAAGNFCFYRLLLSYQVTRCGRRLNLLSG